VTIHDSIKNVLKTAKLEPEELEKAKAQIKEYLKDSKEKMEKDRELTRRQIRDKGIELDKVLTSIVEASTNGSPKMIIDRLNQKFIEISKEREGLEKLLEKLLEQDNCIEQRIIELIDLLQNLSLAWTYGTGKERKELIKNTLEAGFFYDKELNVLNCQFVPLYSGFLALVSQENHDGGQSATLIEHFISLALDKLSIIC
jgi:hypothetical protein